MPKRKPSANKTARGLYQLAFRVEYRAGLLRELGLSNHARALNDAARILSDAASALERIESTRPEGK